jgi:hypothetical protein
MSVYPTEAGIDDRSSREARPVGAVEQPPPRISRSGLGAAKEHPRYASAIPAVSPPIPALEAPTRAPWPVWSGSVAKPVRFAPLAKKAAVRLWHRARGFCHASRRLRWSARHELFRSCDLHDADRDASVMEEVTAPVGCRNVLVVTGSAA